MVVNFKYIRPGVPTPGYAKEGDAGIDLIAAYAYAQDFNQITYGTGIAVEIPEGHVGLIFPRSSISKTGLRLSNSVGVIDSGYRGEIMVKFDIIEGDKAYSLGDRICQLVILPYPQVVLNNVAELSTTDRGEGGFGSTGK